MFFGKKKVSVLDRRLKELQKEMQRVESDMKIAATAVPARPAAAGPGGGIQSAYPRGAAPSPAAPGPAFPAKSSAPPDSDLFAHAPRGSGDVPGAGPVQPTLFDQPESTSSRLSETGMRERFANYFMAGHFQNLRPSRQESRILRNKAIMMIVAVLAVVLWLVYYLQTH